MNQQVQINYGCYHVVKYGIIDTMEEIQEDILKIQKVVNTNIIKSTWKVRLILILQM